MPVHRASSRAARSSVTGALAALAVILTASSAQAVSLTEEAGSPYGTGANPYTAVSADFNGDGRPDVATVNGTSANLSVFLRKPTGGFAQEAGSPFAVGAGPSKAVVADFNADGRPDIAVANYTGGSVTILLRQGAGGFAEEAGSPVAVPNGPSSIATADFNADGRPDLAVTRLDAPAVTVLTRNAGGGFTAEGAYGTGSEPRDVAVADFNGDGRPDLAISNRASDNVTILLRQSAAGGFTTDPITPIAVGDDPQTVAAGDFNGDGRQDFAVTNYGSNSVSVWDRNSANSGFVQELGSPVAVGAGPIGLAAVDLDGDGRLDLVGSDQAANALGALVRKPANDGFAIDLSSVTSSAAGPNGVTVGDYDGDGHPDVAVVSDSTSRLRVYRNTTGNPPSSSSPPAITGVPRPGSTLTCGPGTFTNNPTSYAYVWERAPRAAAAGDFSWAPIAGAGNATYLVPPTDDGSRVRCRVTATAAGGTATAVSASLRVDTSAPVNTLAPHTLGTAVTGRTLTCDPGSWDHGPDLTYRWLRDGVPVAGQTAATFVNQYPWDTDDHVACEVTGTNDVGGSGPVVANALHVVYSEPIPTVSPILRLDTAAANPVGNTGTCLPGGWVRDDGIYAYQWLRDGAVIAGETAANHVTQIADLGHTLSCTVASSNAFGSSKPYPSQGVLVRLPRGTGPGLIYAAGGRNEFDPINMMALSGEYRVAVYQLLVERLKRAVAKQTTACQSMKDVPATVPALKASDFPVKAAMRCAILLHDPTGVDVGQYGVQYTHVAGAKAARVRAHAAQQAAKPCAPGSGACPDLGFRVDPIDPSNAGTLDPDLQAQLDPVTPVTVLWDFNNDGRTDAECPPGAPVVRTMLDKGKWPVSATIVAKNSAATGIYGFAKMDVTSPANTTVSTYRKTLRSGQPFACRTSLLPPPDPDTQSCVRSGTIGRVQVTGNLCPIYLRAIDPDVLAKLPPDVYTTLKAFASKIAVASRAPKRSDEIVVGDDNVTPRSALAPPALGAPVSRASVFATAADAGDDAAGDVDETTVAAYTNTMSALTGFDEDHTAAIDPYRVSDNPTVEELEAKLKTHFDKPKANFALDEIYLAKGKVKVNGVTMTPATAIPTLLVPTDVGNAVTSITSMTINNPDVKTALGGLTLATGGAINTQIPDGKTAATAVLRELNLSALRNQLKDEADKLLNIGPFHITGADADVKLNPDGTATLTAKAEIPLLEDPASKRPIGLDITLNGDAEGHLHLQGVQLRAPAALLGPVNVKDLFLKYDGGLTVQGKILFPPNGEGIDIKNFRIDDDGDLQALDLAYLAGAGSGIPVGPGVYLTKLQGGLDMGPPTIVDAGATVSVGPSAGGGCPTVGVDSDLTATWGTKPPKPAFAVDVTGHVELVCIPLADIAFHADSAGLITLDGGLHFDEGPLTLDAGLHVKVQIPKWQIYAGANVSLRDLPIIGDIGPIGVNFALSNLGMAACASVNIWPLGDVGAGAAVKFPGGVPPITFVQLVANLDIFTGCDLSPYLPLGKSASVAAHGARAGVSTFTIPKDAGGTILSIEGAGAAPRVTLRSPSGKTYDFTDATAPVKVPGAGGQVMEQQDRTVVALKAPEAGRWTAQLAPGSPAVVRVALSRVLPKAKVTAKVSGHGSTRTLTYDVAKLAGQEVRFVEDAPGGLKSIGVVKGGGRGTLRYALGEATGTTRKVVAQVTQDGLPRANLTVATYRAANPKVGRTPGVRVRRDGTRAIVTWKTASLATHYVVSVLSSDGGRTAYLPPAKGKKRQVVSGVARGEGLTVAVVGVSPRGAKGPAGRATLKAKATKKAKAKAQGKAHKR
jgi:hypothetical protein